MIFRSIKAHIEKENWFAVGIDFFIVVVGVFIGMQVANWNEARSDRIDEQATIKALHEEMIAAEALTANIISYRTLYASDIAEATNVLFGLVPERRLSDGECTALAGSSALYLGRVDLPALSRLQATGRLNIVRNSNLNTALVGLLQRREALEIAIGLESAMHDLAHLYPDAFKMQSVLNPSELRENGFERSFTASCDRDYIRTNQNLMNDIALNADTFDAFIRDGLGPWLVQVKEVHKQLDLALKISHDEATP